MSDQLQVNQSAVKLLSTCLSGLPAALGSVRFSGSQDFGASAAIQVSETAVDAAQAALTALQDDADSLARTIERIDHVMTALENYLHDVAVRGGH